MSPAKSRKPQIIAAAIECFNRSGYYQVSLDQIAQTAGITKAGLYYHFNSKKELFISLFLDKANAFFDQLMAVVQEKKTPLEQIAYLFGQEGDLVPRDTEIVQFCIEFMMVSTRDSDIRKVVTAFYNDKIDKITAIIQNGVKTGLLRDIDVRQVARNIYFQSWGYFLIQSTIDIDFNAADQHRLNMDIFLRGLQKNMEP